MNGGSAVFEKCGRCESIAFIKRRGRGLPAAGPDPELRDSQGAAPCFCGLKIWWRTQIFHKSPTKVRRAKLKLFVVIGMKRYADCQTAKSDVSNLIVYAFTGGPGRVKDITCTLHGPGSGTGDGGCGGGQMDRSGQIHQVVWRENLRGMALSGGWVVKDESWTPLVHN